MPRVSALALAAWLLGSITAHGQDMQGKCYPGQTYHGDLAHPDRITPPPGAQYPRARLPTPSQEGLCHLFTIREAPTLPARVVEICQMTPDQELAVRQRMSQPPAAMLEPPWWR
jgi:hypothetical protein